MTDTNLQVIAATLDDALAVILADDCASPFPELTIKRLAKVRRGLQAHLPEVEVERISTFDDYLKGELRLYAGRVGARFKASRFVEHVLADLVERHYGRPDAELFSENAPDGWMQDLYKELGMTQSNPFDADKLEDAIGRKVTALLGSGD